MSKPWNPNAQLLSLRFTAVFSLLSVVYFAYHAFANAFSVWLPEAALLPFNIFNNIPLIWAALGSAMTLTYYLKVRKLGGGGGLKETFGMFEDEFTRTIFQKAASRMGNVMLLTTLMLFLASVLLAHFTQAAMFLNGVTVTSIALSLALLVFGTTILGELAEGENSTSQVG